MSSVLILSEGEADNAFVDRVLKGRNIGEGKWEISSPKKGEAWGFSGFQKRLEGLKTERGIEERTSIVIIADNDDDPAGRFSTIAKYVRDAGEYTVPTSPRGASTRGRYPPVSILMLPWDNEPGALETLCLIPAMQNRPVEAACVNSLVSCVNASAWEIEHLSKLKMRCLLAAVNRSNPSISLSVALRSGDEVFKQMFPPDHSAFNQVAEFFRTLVTPQTA